jgi:serine/threonine-protein kinase
MTPALDRAFLLKGLDPSEPYRLTVEPVGEGAFTREKARGAMRTVACVQWLPQGGGRTLPSKAQRFLLSQGEEARIGGIQGLHCGFIDDDPSDNAGAVRVRVSRAAGNRRVNPGAPYAQVVGTRSTQVETEPSDDASASEAPEEASPAAALLAEGRELSKAGRHAPARSKARECIRLEPGNAECHLLLGSAAVRLGDQEEGARHYRQFLELASSDHPMASRVLRILQEYEAQPTR